MKSLNGQACLLVVPYLLVYLVSILCIFYVIYYYALLISSVFLIKVDALCNGISSPNPKQRYIVGSTKEKMAIN